jgi:hypothetical protein
MLEIVNGQLKARRTGGEAVPANERHHTLRFDAMCVEMNIQVLPDGWSRNLVCNFQVSPEQADEMRRDPHAKDELLRSTRRTP